MSSCLPVVAEDSKGKRKEMSALVAVRSHTKPWSQTWQERERSKHDYHKCINRSKLTEMIQQDYTSILPNRQLNSMFSSVMSFIFDFLFLK